MGGLLNLSEMQAEYVPGGRELVGGVELEDSGEILLTGEGELVPLFVLKEELEGVGKCREDPPGCPLQFLEGRAVGKPSEVDLVGVFEFDHEIVIILLLAVSRR